MAEVFSLRFKYVKGERYVKATDCADLVELLAGHIAEGTMPDFAQLARVLRGDVTGIPLNIHDPEPAHTQEPK